VIAVLDAAYGESASAAACVVATEWGSAEIVEQAVFHGGAPAEYEPG
jgi:deoxyinosine 3'endonuclease (endonuclease V)